MVPSIWALTLATLFTVVASTARLLDSPSFPNVIPRPSIPVFKADHTNRTDVHGTPLPRVDTVYYFNQLIDHQNPQLGTFRERFWMSWEFYRPGGPIVLFSTGESNGDQLTGYLTNGSICGQIAQQQHGAVIVLEHRYYGLSNPFSDLSDNSLRFHTIQQAIDDLEYFATTATLPMPGGGAVKPNQVPWVLVGGSYAGALTSWTMVSKPNLFAAGYAPLPLFKPYRHVLRYHRNFWKYFEPIRLGMPQNCSSDVQVVIRYIDQVFTSGNQNDIDFVKENFGLEDLDDLDDVAATLRGIFFQWQDLTPYTLKEGEFYKFCDALEVGANGIAPPTGFGLNHAFYAWGDYMKNGHLDNLCRGNNVSDCLGTYNPSAPYYKDTDANNDYRAWRWIVCNQVGFFQVGAPAGQPTLVSRLLQPAYEERICTYYFPNKFPAPRAPDADAVNQAYGGWNVNIDHLFFANGRRDPWLEATVSAGSSPYVASAARPVGVSDAFHCSDLISASGYYDPTVAAVQAQGLAAIKTWLAAFRPTASKEDEEKVRFERE